MYSPGPVVWITGLSGSGKTTIAENLVAQLKREGRSAVLLDGDRMRTVLGSEESYTPEERKALAFVYARLCRELGSQGLTVVCATISMFEDVRNWSRENTPGYLEVYLDVPLGVRARRDPKGLYGAQGGSPDMVEKGADYEFPTNPDLTIANHGAVTLERVVQEVMDHLKALA